MTDSKSALILLKEGNMRFVRGQSRNLPRDTSETRRLLAENGQSPYAVVFGCSDSRVPPEIIFNAGLGEIFTVRNAGNVADAVALGSVEYAALHLGAKLVVVLGHTSCGAVAAAVSGEDLGQNIKAITDKIKAPEESNVKNTVSELLKSPALGKLKAVGELDIIGAKYDLITGEVTFFDEN